MAEEYGLEALFGDKPIKTVGPSPLEKALKYIEAWDYYDNYQHGHYVSENDNEHYGPIKVFNATLKCGEEVLFQGDISNGRFRYLRDVSIDCNLIFNIQAEGNQWGFLIIRGSDYSYEMRAGLMVLR